VAIKEPDREVSAPATERLAALLDACACPDCYAGLDEVPGGLRCTGCGRGFNVRDGIPILMPRSGDSMGGKYRANYDAIATADLAKPFEGNRPARHQKLKEFIGSVTNKRVLDIGSSDATYLRQMDARVRVAVDIAFEYLERIPEESGVLGVCGNAEHLPIKAGYFDVVIIADVLEHVLHPEKVVDNLRRICGPRTRLIVHVPWEEDLSQYRDAEYEFTHLRSFNAYNFGLLFRDFYERRGRGTYPYLIAPLPYRLYGRLPRPIYNWMIWIISRGRFGIGEYAYKRYETWIAELPRREWWLLLFYKPIYRMFELRLWRGTLRHRIGVWLRGKVKPSTG
jgi:SAM-dependent methyltransferase